MEDSGGDSKESTQLRGVAEASVRTPAGCELGKEGSASAPPEGPAWAGVAMSRERHSLTDIPRNLSFIASLTERAYYLSQRPSLEEEPEEEPSGGGTRLGARSRAPGPSRERRARSAPAGGGGTRALRNHSPDTRKRVRFADALGLELAAVRRFRPGELPRVPRHVQVQLQRDALRHFAPCQPRARGLQVGGRGTPLPQDFLSLASADVWEWIYLEAPISIPNPGLALAHPLWGSLWRVP